MKLQDIKMQFCGAVEGIREHSVCPVMVITPGYIMKYVWVCRIAHRKGYPCTMREVFSHLSSTIIKLTVEMDVTIGDTQCARYSL